MSRSTESAPDHGNTIAIKELSQLLSELEGLGYVKRTGEFVNGHPVYTPTAAGKEAFASPQHSMREHGVRLTRTGTRARKSTNGKDHST